MKITKFTKKLFFALSLVVSTQIQAEIPSVPDVDAKSFVLMEYETGTILNSENADKKLAPASLTKVMTAFVVFDELKNNRLDVNDEVKISKKAWETEGSRTFVKEGNRIKVDTLIKGMIVQSGNDASVALAEHISGTTDQFATLMNYHAKKLGMKNTNFKNPTGLKDRGHYTTAKDLAILTRSIISNFPEYYYIYQLKQFTHADIMQKSRNRLLFEDLGFDGLKTGYTKEAGYCYIGSSKRGETRMIVTLLGEPNPTKRFEDAKKLVNYGFRFYETHRLIESNVAIKELTTLVIEGQTDLLYVGAKNDILLVLEKGQFDKLKYNVNIIEKAIAPIDSNEVIGEMEILLNDEIIAKTELISLNSVIEGVWHKKLKDLLLSYF